MTNILENLKNLHEKRVLLRVDFNVPIENGIVKNDNRIQAALPTIRYLLNKGAKLILLSHLGRIKKISDKEAHSLRPVANVLNQFLKDHQVLFMPFTRGKHLEQHLSKQRRDEVILLENTRFEDVDETGKIVNYESKNDPKLGHYWASLGDLFVNDAFGTAHRAHASNVGIATAMKDQHKPTAVGYLVEKELVALSKVINHPQKPLVAIVGGAKVSDKIGVLESLLKIADKVIVAGGMAFTFLSAQGFSIGKSLFEPDKINLAKSYLDHYGEKIVLPVDFRCSKKFENVEPLITNDQNIPADLMALDVGPRSSKYFAEILKNARTVIWNGPTGVFEMSHFANGTRDLCATIAALPNAYTVIGGGDSAAAAIEMSYEKKFSHISTGGGASLEFIEGKVLPGIAAIAKA